MTKLLTTLLILLSMNSMGQLKAVITLNDPKMAAPVMHTKYFCNKIGCLVYHPYFIHQPIKELWSDSIQIIHTPTPEYRTERYQVYFSGGVITIDENNNIAIHVGNDSYKLHYTGTLDSITTGTETIKLKHND